jgi:hypothetical protein
MRDVTEDTENTASSTAACWTVLQSCCLATRWSNPLQYFYTARKASKNVLATLKADINFPEDK